MTPVNTNAPGAATAAQPLSIAFAFAAAALLPLVSFGSTSAATAAATATTASAGPATPLVTHHTGTFNGTRVKYDAIVEPIVVANAAGTPAARLVVTTYLATVKGDTSRRPVLFIFNGGPIAPSSILHIGALGPKRLALPVDLGADVSRLAVVDNPYTVLDVADLVFFDPAGTGYSRVLEGIDPKSYFSVTGDGQQLAQLVLEWSHRHGRERSPRYLFGESYGTLRAAATANQLQKTAPLAGVILMGQALNIIEFSQRPANVTSYIVSLPTIAAIAWAHGKAAAGGRSFLELENEVRLFARTDYLTALFQGDSLDEQTRRRIATRLEEYSGIPADYYLAHALRITKEQYRRELFKERGEILGMADARYVGPVDEHGGGDPSMAVVRAYELAFERYQHADLGLHDVGRYITESPVADLEDWRWDGTGTSPFADWPYVSLLSQVFADNPTFRVMVANGWQDTQTTVGAAQLLIDQSGWPRERTGLHFYQGGHMAYSVEDSLRQLCADVRQFVTH